MTICCCNDGRRSERDARRQLNLARRADVPCHETRTRNSAKVRTANNRPGWTEVRMVQQIEHVRAELCERAAESQRFDDGRVEIVEARTDDGVAGEVPEVVDCAEPRRVEPLICLTDDANGTGHIGTER